MVVNADLPHGLNSDSRGPRKDYTALAAALDASVLDRTLTERSMAGRLIRRVLGVSVAQACLAFSSRHQYDVLLTDGEQIGIPLALLLKAANMRMPHVMIGHRISAAKKRVFFRQLKVHSHITRIALHARRQYDIGVSDLGILPEQLALVPYQADADFWRPEPESEERLICSAGLEFRDYPILMRAVDGLDVQVAIGAASHWSKRRNTVDDADLPPNVSVASFDFLQLRKLYALSSMVVVPLENVDFQAGITTILEAMAMAKPIIVTATEGQSDVVEDRRGNVRGMPARPVSYLRELADRYGIRLEPNGLYVPPGDPAALRRAILYLLDHPEERRRLGMAGRRTIERLLTVDQFADRMRTLAFQAYAACSPQGAERIAMLAESLSGAGQS